MKTFELSIKKVCQGKAIVEADNKEEAIEIFKNGGEKDFEDYSQDYPVDWTIEEVIEQYEGNLSIEILQHKVEYWYDKHPEKEMNQIDLEHVCNMIKEGYSSGELLQYDDGLNETFRGWWEIVK